MKTSTFFLCLLFLLLSISIVLVNCEKEEIKIEKTKPEEEEGSTQTSSPNNDEKQEKEQQDDEANYEAPTPKGALFFDNFNSDPTSLGGKWKVSKVDKFKGTWKWATPLSLPGFKSDKGLMTSDAAKFYAISTVFDKPIDNTNKDLVVQYEVKFAESSGLGCGGAYVKLTKHQENYSSDNFGDNTPYVIMFGPDKCGTTNKVHFIFRHYNPKSKKWEEKHLNNPPSIKNDNLSHLYTLIVNKDNTYEILVDTKSAKKGSLFKDFTPSVVPPKEIPDPSDKKPKDWVDEKEIDDPKAKKPEDWDETQPREIVDPNDKKPEGWLDDGKAKIPDPKAKKPTDWDDEEDGKWEAPLIDNEVCQKVGCGVWKPRKIPNPKYKGKWVPPKIPNPKYKGEWKAKMIPNPHYFEDKNPHSLTKISGVGIEIWTMTKNILFDNFMITHSKEAAEDFAKATWTVKNARELAKKKKEDEANRKASKGDQFDKFKQQIIEGAKNYWIPIVTVLVAFLISIPLLCCRGGSTPKPETKKEESDKEDDKKDDDKEEDKKEDKKDDKEEEKKDEKVEEEKKEEEEKEEEEKKEEKKETKKKKKKKKSRRLN